MKSTTGIKDVAVHAGVSIKTVSRVINGVPTVTPETRARVEFSIAELNFVPNTMARALRTGTTEAIGVVVDTIDDAFFSSLISVIERNALDAGLDVVIASTGFNRERERDQLLRLAVQRIRGIILAPVAHTHPYLERFRQETPIVMVDRATEGFDSVVVNDIEATRDAINSLIHAGHSRIAFIGRDDRFPTTTRRLEGYNRALSDAGLPLDTRLAPSSAAEINNALDTTLRLLSEPNAPTAFFAANSRSGIGIVTALHTSGRLDVALISFGDFTLADVLKPPVTYINQDSYRIGVTAFERLSTLMGTTGSQPKHIVLNAELIKRGSGEISPYIDERVTQ